MKHFKKVMLASGIGLLAWQYYQYRQDKINAIARLRQGSQLVQLDLGQMEYAVEGSGKPMLSVHGGGGGYEQGLTVGRLLNYDDTFQVIAPSRSGARQSHLSTGRTFAEQATAYTQLLDHLKIDKAVVVGLSGGGLSTLQFALDYPERCEALILVSAVSPIIAQLHVPKAALTLLDAVMSSDFLVWLIQKLSLNLLYQVDGTKREDYGEDSAIHELISNFFPSSDWRDNVMNEMEQVLTLKDFRFEDVTVPTLLLHGDKDPITSLKVAQTTASRVPGAKLIRIPNGSHLMIGSDTEILHDHIRQFLAEI